ncbi:MAG: hypothetical protein LBM74_04670, partial [Oscillospiraceae bacterium]|nr:hypothetical protein [Oscillospiraceae bacterium]
IRIAWAKLGDLTLVALPFETYTETADRIRKALSGRPVMVLGCAEELLGYLPTREDIARGSYAALESTFLYKRLPALPGEAERLGEETGMGLQGIVE